MQTPIKPMLAKATEPHPVLLERQGMFWEPKYDGYRLVAELRGDESPVLWSRAGRAVTGDFPLLARQLARTGCRGVLDGEIVVLVDGRPSFHALQLKSVLREEKLREVMRYVAFDVLQSGEHDLVASRMPYEQRRLILKTAVAGIESEMVVVVPSYADGRGVWRAMERAGMEGMIGKPAGSAYRPGERGTWIKLKRKQVGQFRVVGYTWGDGARTEAIGSLVLAVPLPNGRLAYAGKVGTGFTGKTLGEVKTALDGLIARQPPFDAAEWAKARAQLGPEEIVWLRPERDATVEFAETTKDGVLRFPSFKGLR